ncbi:AAA domain-containing protein [Paracrocinitomix mangrovi]|uniref:AAA domain-containing protein n=1 Tax=Paracrocinitomix mangrovi TaxID=2862509 RepID=UPI001C8E9C52|nr:AAA domain-containing protein [Paracrocinitomix mangrovi]UKN01063.1 AAA domain-containing protein [Paracrocinitomix mangrovi]
MDITEHFRQLERALEIEKNEELALYKKLTEKSSFLERIEAGITLYPIEFRELSYNQFGDQLITVLKNPTQEGSAFGVGQLVSIFNNDGESCEGQLIQEREKTLKIRILDDDVRDWIKDGNVGLNALVDTKTYELYLSIVLQIINGLKYPVLSDFYNLRTRDFESIEYQNSKLNNSQIEAVEEMLSDNSVSIIHGPPGTGKTTTLVAGMKAMIHEGKKILLCAPSNAAVDNVCEKLIKENVKVVRVGNAAKATDAAQQADLDFLVQKDQSFKLIKNLQDQANKIREKAFKYKRNFGKEEYEERKRLKNEFRSLRADIKQLQKDITRNILENATVICGTFVGVQGIARSIENFDAVVIDEAGQAIEPSIWSVAHYARKLVIAGDDLQLPPTVKSMEADKLGLSKSVLEIATEINFPKHLLNVQYRMNERIMGFSDFEFYEGLLSAHESVARKVLDYDQFEPVEFIDTAGCSMDETKDEESGAIHNIGEVEIIKAVLKEHKPQQYSLGVITPYRAQLHLIQDELKEITEYSNTVDSFQGQERDIIVISLVRSNEKGEIGFLKDYRRMNVAMTRAKLKLIMIGDSATLGQDEFYGRFLDYVEKVGSYRTAWEFIS